VFERATYSSIFPLFEAIVSIMTAARETETDAHWMRHALAAAHEAGGRGEVPVGTCIVSGETLLAIAGNRTRTDNDPTAHAEIVALRAAARTAGNYRLANAVVYSTIEPCVMCAGALIQARVKRLVYGALDERAGAVQSQFRVCDTDFLNHRIEVTAGVLEDECREIMQEFFRARREAKAEGGRMKDESSSGM
jgi:tRNA(adenine34) deaminase